MYYIYMLRCKNNAVYTGITVDVRKRMKEHFNKTDKCAKYTRTHSAEKLEAVWQSENRSLASKLEFYIKRLSKKQKEKLISDNDFSPLKNKLNKENYIKIQLDFDILGDD